MAADRVGTVWLQVRPDGALRLRVVGSTKSRPSTIHGDAILVRVRLRIPADAFAGPVAQITVPESAVIAPVEVEPIDLPDEEGEQP